MVAAGDEPSATRTVPGFCTLCKSRCGALFTVREDHIVKVEPDFSHPNGDALCPKGRAAPEIADHPARLSTPLRRTSPKGKLPARWEPISWDEAVRVTREALNSLKNLHGANTIALQHTSPSGTALSDSMEWIDRLFRLIGSANILTSTENCNWHKDFTHTFTFGARTPPANWLDAKLGILWGHNPAKTWLAQASLISRARSRGMKLVVIDPRRSTSALDADLWLRVKPGADAALALCAVRELIETGRYDKEFIGCWSNAPFLIDDRTGCFLRPSAGSAQFVVWNSRHGRPEATSTECADPNWTDWSLRYRGTVETPSGPVQASTALNHLWTAAAPWDYGTTSTHTGIPISELRKFIDLLTEAMPAIGYHAWTGIAQHANATQTERAIACLYALLGGFDRRGGNVQLPVLPARSTAVSTPLKNIATGAGGQRHPLGGSQIGYITGADFQDAVLDENPYPIRALLSFGANPILTQPDSKRTAKALSKLEFYVHVDLFHNPSNEYADVLLPSSSLYENDSVRLGWELTVEGAERLQYRPQLVSRRGDTRSDAEIAFLLARALGYHDDEYFALDLDAARDRVLEPLGITLAELKEKLVAKIPLHASYEKYRTHGFNTPSRRAELYSERLHEAGQDAVPHFAAAPAAANGLPYLLSCVKNGYYCHSQHRAINSLRKRAPHPNVYVSERVAARHQLSPGMAAEIHTSAGAVTMTVEVDPSLADDVLIAEFGWWEGNPDLGLPALDALSASGSNYNTMITTAVADPVSGSIPFRSIPCTIGPAASLTTWAGKRLFTVTGRRMQTSDITTVTLSPVDRLPLPEFISGQYLELSMPGQPDRSRRYSLTCQSLDVGSSYEISVKRIEGGEISPLIHQVSIGDEIECAAPAGAFTVPHADNSSPLVFVAIGVGITPFISALRTAAYCTQAPRRPHITLLYSSRTFADMAYASELVQIGRILGDRFDMTAFLTRAPDAGEFQGVHHVVYRRFTPADIPDRILGAGGRVYYCGPAESAREIKQHLAIRGVGAHRFFYESFHAPTSSRHIPAADTIVSFARSNRTTKWVAAEGLTLLALAERNGISAPSGCRVGQCESCATRLVRGNVAHLVEVNDDYLDGSSCLTCQSIPMGDVVLDL
ncbi:molybdopterin-dependent oxidoreductase [Mycobacteroides abscessus]|uniref:molybdopterin-dependent oxidoreductase n=1 Tax=Mycobacteroides abscessus TaxID=36809 RepID=UPI0005DBA626|nr:molybdopterin-dependent oxidoreductase [Mycobacteroides abscessus]CPS19120.1 flavodoxin reductase family protein [Mycobacteroides abscessus]CPS47223.1 flavodoxin reductase family protein [Mycobacteroides abscessus]CPS48496.1 flavodoxin reductase family protein [Mycobacteroides abscessus]CPT41238.1 flavodoxin reductase family protein [Mycobacteroides abscessus]CPT41842.1 flavodoxin reductase family protein [Mycobacteroides abscessus]